MRKGLILLILAAFSANLNAAIIYVKSGATGAADGSTCADAYTALQTALTNWTLVPKGRKNRWVNGFSSPALAITARTPKLNPMNVKADMLIPNNHTKYRVMRWALVPKTASCNVVV